MKKTNHIASSKTIQEFLDKEKIVVKPDEFAPVVFEWGITNPSGSYGVCAKGDVAFPRNYTCPYFGPGGEGNLLKALHAYIMQSGGWLRRQYHDGFIYWSLQRYGEDGCHDFIADGKGKTDGIALHDLLHKIATEDTGERSNDDE